MCLETERLLEITVNPQTLIVRNRQLLYATLDSFERRVAPQNLLLDGRIDKIRF